MADKVQLIKQEIERLEAYPQSRGFIKHMIAFIDSLPEESTDEANCTPENEDLEEAASEYVREDFHERSRADFKAGAEWYKQQMKETLQTEYEKGLFDMREEMMKDAVDAFVNTYENSDCSNYVEFVTEQSPYKFKETEKCKIIIVKED